MLSLGESPFQTRVRQVCPSTSKKLEANSPPKKAQALTRPLSRERSSATRDQSELDFATFAALAGGAHHNGCGDSVLHCNPNRLVERDLLR
jgi:hypothetical protein